MNCLIIKNFNDLINFTKLTQNNYRTDGDIANAKKYGYKQATFKKALKSLEEYDQDIINGVQVKDLSGIGSGIIKRIDEIIATGKLSEINSENSTLHELDNLLRITGIGDSKAKKLLDDGITLQYLLDNIGDSKLENILTHHQLLGLKYFHDFEKRIPRKEIKSLEKKLNKLVELDSKLEVIICGSYRRNLTTSGDIDVLITRKDIKTKDDLINNNDILKKIVEFYSDNGLLIDSLTNNVTTKYMGVCKNTPKSVSRRIDIRFIPMESIYFAMLYFTGSGTFNKNMRTYALKKGYKLNEYGLFKSNFKFNVKCENDIFDILDLDYVNPEDRVNNYIFIFKDE